MAQNSQENRYRVGVDIGGTFTDFVVHDRIDGSVEGFKLLTTPEAPSRAIFDGLARLRERSGCRPEAVQVLVHATTLATNTIIEGTGARTALVTTEGFRDILEIRRENRYDDRDLTPVFPPPLVPRHLRHEVRERCLADGAVRVPLDEVAARLTLAALGKMNVETIAISLLHSPVNAAHEKRLAEIAEEVVPHIPVSLSNEVQPEKREYERTSTTVANAYIQPQVRSYLDTLSANLADQGHGMPVYIMQSNGGFATPAETRLFPVRMIESGPAAGAIAAASFGRNAGENALISFDMGGTTAKIAVIRDGEPRIVTELEVARVHRLKQGSGYPILCPSVELSEIGAGGGSIASIDALGRLKVGPHSAGASPGPVCYGLGGTEPTVTDADLILGYLDDDSFAGGQMKLDRTGAERVIMEKIAEPSGLDLVRAAWGIHDVINQNMATAGRLHVLACGEDPRRFTMVAFGGAGPVHAHRVAEALGIRRILYPYGAGVASAHGLLVAPMARDLVRAYHAALDDIDWDWVSRLVREMEMEASAAMLTEAGGAISFTAVAELRFVGQGYELRIPVPDGANAEERHVQLEADFLNTYEVTFGRRIEGVPIEMMNLRLFARGPRYDIHCVAVASGTKAVLKGRRPVYFGGAGDFIETAVHDREQLRAGAVITGPALIEGTDTTIVVPPEAEGSVLDDGSIIVESKFTTPAGAA